MPVSITIRDVPNEVRDVLAARAARSGRSLQEYLSLRLREIAETPQVDEWLDRVRSSARTFSPVTNEQILEAIHADRR